MNRLEIIRAKRDVLNMPHDGPAPVEWQEIRRIIGLPMVLPFEGPEVEEFSRTHVLATAYDEGFRLWGAQCEAVAAYMQYGGLFSPIGVGWGKTLITQMIAHEATKKGFKRIMLLAPSSTVHQLVRIMFPIARSVVPINYPLLVLHGKSAAARRALAHSGKRGVYINTYALLSRKDAEECLWAIKPELIICDEADHLGNRKSARTKRLLKYIDKHQPEGAVLSGTITRDTITDYAHLIKWVLGRKSPLPLSGHLVDEWASRIDANAPTQTEATGPIVPLLEWARERFPDQEITEDVAGFRCAFKLRLKTAPGVVATGDAEIGPSLIIDNLPVPSPEKVKGWDEMQRLIEQVTKANLTPNMDEIDHAIHRYKWLYELTLGFYNELTYPTAAVFADREGTSFADAELILDTAEGLHMCQQEFNGAMRRWIDDFGRRGLDTPLLVKGNMAHHRGKHTGMDLYELWRDWHDLRDELTVVLTKARARPMGERDLAKRLARCLRDKNAVRVCPYKIDHAVRWAKSLSKKNPGAIIWVYNIEVGRWVVEALREAGIENCSHRPAGERHNIGIEEDSTRADTIIVASMRAHGRGKNLQRLNQCLMVQWPRAAKLAEQLLGRLHRNGQQANQVWSNSVCTTEFDELCMAATLNDALYIHQTTGNRQKLIYCTYPTTPKIFPSEVLRERGFENKELTAEARKALRERFAQEIEKSS